MNTSTVRPIIGKICGIAEVFEYQLQAVWNLTSETAVAKTSQRGTTWWNVVKGTCTGLACCKKMH